MIIEGYFTVRSIPLFSCHAALSLMLSNPMIDVTFTPLICNLATINVPYFISGVQLNEFLVNEELDSALSNNEEIKKSFMLRLLSSC